MKRTDPGRRIHQVTIEGPPPATDWGDEPKSAPWVVVAATLASVSPVSGRELVQLGQTLGETTHRLNIRYRAGVRQKHRVRHQGRIFEIEQVLDPEERHFELDLYCKELDQQQGS